MGGWRNTGLLWRRRALVTLLRAVVDTHFAPFGTMDDR
jgi:hypothetical protein